MEINNAEYVLKNRKRMYIYSIALAIMLPIILISDWFENPILGLSRNVLAILIISIYIIYYIIRFIMNINFLQFTLDSNKLNVRYYSLRPLSKTHNTIEIPLNAFAGYKIQSKFFGLRKDLVLYQKIQHKMAKYPPISLSALNKKQFIQLINLLNTITFNVRS